MENQHYNKLGIKQEEEDWGQEIPVQNITVQIKKEFGEEMEYGENKFPAALDLPEDPDDMKIHLNKDNMIHGLFIKQEECKDEIDVVEHEIPGNEG
ncbi:unnamed protein product [Leptidea sinapis]|uniref:Uncharacterized protein n=1 Tax=Leptidea sinapis TaxID=189913 RepID=A0A5E4QQ79_9NEOP|nr:unnamed protein product [Leptidea sinapis]